MDKRSKKQQTQDETFERGRRHGIDQSCTFIRNLASVMGKNAVLHETQVLAAFLMKMAPNMEKLKLVNPPLSERTPSADSPRIIV